LRYVSRLTWFHPGSTNCWIFSLAVPAPPPVVAPSDAPVAAPSNAPVAVPVVAPVTVADDAPIGVPTGGASSVVPFASLAACILALLSVF
jgi:hypothetical protein